jgi:CHASE3 domain sensor protein
MAIGALIIVSWHARWTAILQIIPDFPAMQYNTALCFLLCGLSLILHTTKTAKSAPLYGGLAGIFALLTLLEYSFAVDLRIDQLLFKPYFTNATSAPGRMSQLTAACFTVVGITFLLTGVKWKRRRPLMGVLVCVVGVISTGSVLGYFAGVNSAFGWGIYAPMAALTALALLLLVGGLWICIWREEREEKIGGFHYARWLPLIASLTLAVMIALVFNASFTNLRSSLEWRKHTYEVLLVAQSFQASLTDIQNDTSTHVLAGSTLSSAPYQDAGDAALKKLSHLQKLTRDNAIQQQRLIRIHTETQALLEQARQLTEAREQHGLSAAAKMESSDLKNPVAAHLRLLVQAFTNEEQSLLAKRSIIAENEFHDTLHLLGLCGGLALVLLVINNYMTSQEFARRSRAEANSTKLITELQQAIVEVKTLSGMIPICGWCKSIRTDKGYWQSVEQYVRSHTDATFTHGVCPECSKKFMADIQKANPGPDRS